MHKTVDIAEGKSVTVHELTVNQIINLLNDDALAGDTELGMGSIQDFAKRHLPNATDLKVEDMMDMAPSELKVVYDAFAEVNSVFFDTARAVGLETLLSELKSAITEDFSKVLAASLKQDT
jgi:hypothetical protein